MTTPYPALFEPLVIGHLRLKNRLMSTSHAPACAEGGMPKERYRRYDEEKAKGGLHEDDAMEIVRLHVEAGLVLTPDVRLVSVRPRGKRQNPWIPAFAGITGEWHRAYCLSFPRRRESMGMNMTADGSIASTGE